MQESEAVAVSAASPADLDSAGLAPRKRLMHTNRKGSAWRYLVQNFLEDIGMAVTRRGIGDAGDDLTATMTGMNLSVEAKNHRQIRLAEFVDQAEQQAPEDAIPIVFVHRPNKASVDDGYVVMSGRAFRRLLQ